MNVAQFTEQKSFICSFYVTYFRSHVWYLSLEVKGFDRPLIFFSADLCQVKLNLPMGRHLVSACEPWRLISDWGFTDLPDSPDWPLTLLKAPLGQEGLMEYEDISRLLGSKTSTRDKAGDCLTHNEQAFNGDPPTNPGGKNERLDREMEAERIRSTEKSWWI